MMTRRRLAAIAAGLVTAIGLAGCSGLPTDGTFQAGLPADEPAQDARWQFSAEGPEEGAEPVAIVLGFLDAGESPANDWEIAREFLTDEAAAEWDPDARVTVENIEDRNIGEFNGEGDEGEVSVAVSPAATVDGSGRYQRANETVRALDFELARVDGEWRIASAPDGVVIQNETFSSIFRPQSLVFAGPGDRLVPDLRWFPDGSGLVKDVVTELVEGGPAPWLELAVTTAFDDIELRGVSANATDQVVTVSLSSAAEDVGAARRARMQTQLEETLAPLGFEEVRMMVGDSRIVAPEDTVTSVEPDARALVMTEDDFGYLSGGDITPIEGLSAIMRARFTSESDAGDPATSIVVAPDLKSAVVQTEAGALWRVDAEAEEFRALSYEDGWLAPSLDAFGYAWSADPGDPDTLLAWGEGDEPLELVGAAGLTSVSALQLSRDGARIAIAGRQDDQAVLLVAGVRRDADGAPIGLSGVQDVSDLPSPAESVAWVSDTVVAARIADSGTTLIHEQEVGGTAARLTASFASDWLTYGNPQSRERLLSSDGSIYVRSSTTWEQAGSGVEVLATQMGAPPTTGR